MEEKQDDIDLRFMNMALAEAQEAYKKDEVPVGAVLVSNGQIIARAHNLSEVLTDATAHAEMQAITMGSSYLGAKFLQDCTLYVTLEPCTMCAGALYWSRVKRLVFGAKDEKRGYLVHGKKLLHPKTEVKSGILEEDCSELLKSFFESKRKL